MITTTVIGANPKDNMTIKGKLQEILLRTDRIQNGKIDLVHLEHDIEEIMALFQKEKYSCDLQGNRKECMDTVEVVKLIKTTLKRRGDGTPEDPVRIITEYWTMDGEKVMEIDPEKYVNRKLKGSL